MNPNNNENTITEINEIELIGSENSQASGSNITLDETNSRLAQIPRLQTLVSLQESIRESQQKTELRLASLRNNVSKLLIHVSLEELEKIVSSFIDQELIKRGFSEKIAITNERIVQKLNEINFFGDGASGKAHSFLTGFFSSEFSIEDKKKWMEIELLLSNLYDSDSGYVRELQDHFLFNIESANLAKLVGKKDLNSDEEVFIQTILVKCYLLNLQQLILPFYQLDDQLLIKFKREQISKLQERKLLEPANVEISEQISLLTQRVDELELQSKMIKLDGGEFHKKVSVTNKNLTAWNVKLNTGSVALGSFETARYFTSFIGHSNDINVLKNVGNFGLKSTGFVARCIPFLSAAVEAGTQMNNNYVVYDYEKKLKMISIIDSVKRNIFILNQRATNHFFDNLLNRFHGNLLASQERTNQLLNQYYQEHLVVKKGEKELSEKFGLVADEYQQNISTVITEKDKLIFDRDEEVKQKEQRILELDYQLIDLNNEIDNTKRERDRIRREKLQEEERLNRSILSVQKDLGLTKELLEQQQESLRLREQNADQAIANSLAGETGPLLLLQIEKRNELEATVNVLLKKENDLNNDLADLRSKLTAYQQELNEEKECAKGINERLSGKLSELRKKEQATSEELTKLRNQLRNYNSVQLELQNLRENLERKNGIIASRTEELDAYEKLKVEYEQVIIKLEDTQGKVGACDIVIGNRDREITKLKKDLGNVNKQLEPLQTEQQSSFFNFQSISNWKDDIYSVVWSLTGFILLSLFFITALITMIKAWFSWMIRSFFSRKEKEIVIQQIPLQVSTKVRRSKK